MARRCVALDRCDGCRPHSDMECPTSHRLEALLDELADAGFDAHFNEIDAHMARSPFSRCTNCGARGRFTYRGMKSEDSYRAFWCCRSCGHWMEV
ncbi:MAG: hypothetical protein M3285_03005 [Actinomycetota bacterium]|nr:hypothetical protein [Actinomycetota bacterium]